MDYLNRKDDVKKFTPKYYKFPQSYSCMTEKKDYFITGVSYDDYLTLKDEEKKIMDSVNDEFDSTWKTRLSGIKVTFLYNREKSMIGICIKKKKEEILAFDEGNLNEEENTFVSKLHSKLEEKISSLMLPRIKNLKKNTQSYSK